MSRAKEVTHKIMASVKQKDTEPELILRKALWNKGYRYRKNFKSLPGKPDLVFLGRKVAVFCDGDFWHGHNWAVRGLKSLDEELEGYSAFWQAKITGNIERDKRNTAKLQSMGWTVVRLWESEIRNNLESCIAKVEDALGTGGAHG